MKSSVLYRLIITIAATLSLLASFAARATVLTYSFSGTTMSCFVNCSSSNTAENTFLNGKSFTGTYSYDDATVGTTGDASTFRDYASSFNVTLNIGSGVYTMTMTNGAWEILRNHDFNGEDRVYLYSMPPPTFGGTGTASFTPVVPAGSYQSYIKFDDSTAGNVLTSTALSGWPQTTAAWSSGFAGIEFYIRDASFNIVGFRGAFTTLTLGPATFGTNTIGLYRGSTNTYFLRNTNSFGAPDITRPFGAPGDIPVVGDWNGDGVTSLGIYRPSQSTFYLSNDNVNISAIIPFGAPGDIPIVGDWDGNGTTTVGIYRPSNNAFFLSNNNTSVAIIAPFGAPGDLPVAGDWDGNGTTTIGIYRPSNNAYFLSNNNTSVAIIAPFGTTNDVPVYGDFDGNGTTTIGIYRPTTSTFYLSNNNTSVFTTIPFGTLNDTPVIGDWDGL